MYNYWRIGDDEMLFVSAVLPPACDYSKNQEMIKIYSNKDLYK